MIILGINSVYHESAAAICVDGDIIAAAEEERFNRQKHGKPATISNPNQLPVESIQYCLRQAKIKPSDIDQVAFSFDLSNREKEFSLDPQALSGGWGTFEGEQIFRQALTKVPDEISALLDRDIKDRFSWVPHHIAHAASAYYPTKEDSAAILVIDGIGESASTLLAFGEHKIIKTLDNISYPNSLGFLWEKLSEFLGFSEYDACKVMGMAAYGNKETYQNAFEKFVHPNEQGFVVDPEVLLFRANRWDRLAEYLGEKRKKDEPILQKHYDIAASLQAATKQILENLLRLLYAKAPTKTLCMAGGVALNCSANWDLINSSPYKKIYIPSAPHDSGTAIGAALYVANQHKSTAQKSNHHYYLSTTPYLGPEFSEAEIKQAFLSAATQPIKVKEKEKLAALLISQGYIVGWFQGRMEFGPRALGNRSLLADPRDLNTRHVMNQKVKHREDFRPFGPSVLSEYANQWFDIIGESESYKYMLFACPVKPDMSNRIPAVVHADNTSRIQVVDKNLNPCYHQLITWFEHFTKVPMVLNTSFNDSEPIVCSPTDALHTFKQTNIDVVFIGDYVSQRNNIIPDDFLCR